MSNSLSFLGFAGSDAKVEFLKKNGFDAAYSYKTISSLHVQKADMFHNNVKHLIIDLRKFVALWRPSSIQTQLGGYELEKLFIKCSSKFIVLRNHRLHY